MFKAKPQIVNNKNKKNVSRFVTELERNTLKLSDEPHVLRTGVL